MNAGHFSFSLDFFKTFYVVNVVASNGSDDHLNC